MQKQYDAIIIGGGIIGASIACEMAKRGLKVVVVEKERIACRASSAAGGMLGAQVEMGKEVGPLFNLAIRSRALFASLVEELRESSGIDANLITKGMLRIAFTEEEKREFQEVIAYHHRAGQKAEWLEGREVRSRESGLTGEIAGAMYIPDDGQLLAPELSQAFAKTAANRGAEIREFTEVTSLIIENGKVSGVQTDNGCITADEVIIASGAWSEKLLKQTGIELGTYPVKGECFSVKTTTPLLTSTVFSHGCYLVPKRGSRLLVGATVKERTFDQKVTVEGIRLLMQRAMRILPGIVDAEWEKAWAGLRPQTRDGLPYLGRHPKFTNLIVASGHFRNGILLSAITGVIVADLVEGRRTDGIDLAPFALDRHAEVKAGVR
ncbi:glycine oxidase ThiO [Aneurinibacillus sp. Ricciae_BoGa-3]|uniref:glycine oxidase ThiO n=1 Tax=Aneurinibacillus sp. Ricciae_BoGa-3 TaxID=3022697 RepID=UPI00233FB2C8|nr:glycine oxidase ThiO [Aneurinibacillus sp. Ricciae_BoGa-3]WCK55271.1 glycine oxidase ThiO [Aneurinibacillus sp. Ricciae_BoGa-3]